MKRFNYSCRKNDVVVDGYVDANTIEQAVSMLQKNGYVIIQIVEDIEYSFRNLNVQKQPFTIKEKKEFYSALYYQYKGGLPIVEVFGSIATSTKNLKVKSIAGNITLQLKQGKSFDIIISQYVEMLGRENVMLLIAGEESGKLCETSYGILKNIEKEEAILNSITSKSIYPLIVLGLALFSFLVMKLFVFPQIKNAVNGVGTDVNVVAILVQKLVLILIIMSVIIFGIKKLYKSRIFADFVKEFVFNLKPVKKAYSLFCFVIFFRLLSISYCAGCPLIKGIGLAESTIKDFNIKSKVSKIYKMIQEGTEVSSAFRISGIFSDFAVSQVVSAEQTGEFDEAFKLIANDYESELNIQVKVLINLFQLIAFLICAVVVVITAIGFFTTYYNALFSLF